MRVLQVNNTDLVGRRFNGFDLMPPLLERGVHCDMVVLDKASDHPAVFSLIKTETDARIRSGAAQLEIAYGMNGVLHPWGHALSQTVAFRDADVVHYHLIHNQVISLMDLPLLMRLKPSVWTFHDPWPLTGHCIHPMECEGWKTGCETCAFPGRQFAIKDGSSGRMWRVKQRVYSEVEVDIVVASPFMVDMVRRSPLGRFFDSVHLIPFGVDDLSAQDKRASRAALGIGQDSFSILLRATESEFKGLRYLVEALRSAPPVRPTTLLVVDQRGLLRDLESQYDVRDFGWVGDAEYGLLLGACDALVMPSVAEAFGLMAVEAMSAGRPVVCFEGTSLPSVTHAPECGIAVPMADTTALRAALDDLATKPDECARRGRLGQRIASRDYSSDRYACGLLELYETVAKKPHGLRRPRA